MRGPSYKFLNEEDELKALGDTWYLYYWIEQNASSPEEYVKYRGEMQYGDYVFFKKMLDKSNIFCADKRHTVIYAIIEGNKLLRCAYNDEEYIFELFANADKFKIVDEKFTRYNIPNPGDYEIFDHHVSIVIKNDSTGVVTSSEEEILHNSLDSFKFHLGVYLKDVLEPISVEELYRNYHIIKKESDDMIEKHRQYVKTWRENLNK